MGIFPQKRKFYAKRVGKGSKLTARVQRVERVLRAGREQKVARVSGELSISSQINSSKLINLLPDIPQDATSGGRVGNEIRLKKLMIKSWVQYAPTDVNNRVPRNEANVMCRHFILRQKDQQSGISLLSPSLLFVDDELLESGGFTQANEFRNIMSPVNRDIFTVKSDRKRRITNAIDTTDPNSDAEANPYNFVVFNKTMGFGKMGKKLTFSKDAGVVQPVQFPWVMTAGYCNTNGTAAPFTAAKIFYDITAYYTDA